MSVKTGKNLFQKGYDPRRNLKGKPVGIRNFSTDFDEAVEEIAKEEGITKSQARKTLLKRAYKEAKAGNYNFYKDIIDRDYGKAPDVIDVNARVKSEPMSEERFFELNRKYAERAKNRKVVDD